jgi:hypothetical protein
MDRDRVVMLSRELDELGRQEGHAFVVTLLATGSHRARSNTALDRRYR